MSDEKNKESCNEAVEREKLFHEYDQALEIGHHGDTVLYEVTAIVWGANTLLLGFILEVPCESSNQRLVLLSAIVGFFLSAYVPLVYRLIKSGQRIAFSKSAEIEADLGLKHKIHTEIRARYPKWHPGEIAMWLLSALFLIGWLYVCVNSWNCLDQNHVPPQIGAYILVPISTIEYAGGVGRASLLSCGNFLTII